MGPIPAALAMGMAIVVVGWWIGLDGGLIALLAFVSVPGPVFLSWVRRQEEKDMAQMLRDSRAARRYWIGFLKYTIAVIVVFGSIELFWPGIGKLAVFLCCVAMIFVVGYGVLVGEIVRMGRRWARRAD